VYKYALVVILQEMRKETVMPLLGGKLAVACIPSFFVWCGGGNNQIFA